MNRWLRMGTLALALGAVMAAPLLLSAPARAQTTEGTLQALNDDGEPMGACPLKHTDVQADIAGFVARVTVTQQFENPFDDFIEAVYTFPLSEDGAVDRMTMTIGDRVIRGVIKEREEARKIYEQAKQEGKAASLLDQERPNIFTQSVANIPPGEGITIEISYVEYLDYEDGAYTFAFPMVVGPRYIPAGMQSGDADRITPPVTPEGTRAGHDIALTVRLDAGVPVKGVESELHAVDVEEVSETGRVVTLKNQQTIPNRDFVLRYDVAGGQIEDAVLLHHDERGGYFTLIMMPPKRVQPGEIAPKELYFVIDSSGSMRGFPIEKAKATMRQCIDQMHPNDTFNLMTFAAGTRVCFPEPVPNTRENRETALAFLDNLQGSGGTEMMTAIRQALERQDPDRLRVVCFMTDGYVGNDMEIVNTIQKNAGTARVFSFGIGNSVNRFLIEQMAHAGRGESRIVTLESDGDEAAREFAERMRSPLLTDIRVALGGEEGDGRPAVMFDDVYPAPDAVPDLFAAKPLVVTGRYTLIEGVDRVPDALTVTGRTPQGAFERKVPVTFTRDAGNDVLATLWARRQVRALMARDWQGVQRGQVAPELKQQIIGLGLKYDLLTQFTSFVAVEEKVINEGGETRTVEVPVEMPDGVSYEGVFGEQASMAGGMPKAAPMSAPAQTRGRQFFAGAPEAAEMAPLPEPQADSAAAPEEERDEAGPVWTAELLAKLDQPLRDRVARGDEATVEVYVTLTALSGETLASVRTAGDSVRILAETRSSNRLYLRIAMKDLHALAKLDAVTTVATTP